MQKKTSLLKTSGDKDKKKKGSLKVGFSIEGEEMIETATVDQPLTKAKSALPLEPTVKVPQHPMLHKQST